MRISGSGFNMPVQGPQAPQQSQKAEAPKPQAAPPKEGGGEIAKDENKTKSFSETPIDDVNAFPFEGEPTAATEAIEEIESLFDAEAPEEAGEAEEAEGEVEGPEEAEGAEPAEVEVEEAEEEAEGGGVEDYDTESEKEREAPEIRINTAALLELIPELKEAPKFRIEETWGLFSK